MKEYYNPTDLPTAKDQESLTKVSDKKDLYIIPSFQIPSIGEFND